MRTINIGKLNKRITFLKLGEREDDMGQSAQALEEIKTVWASFYPIRGMEFYEVQKVQGKVTHKCYVRYLKGVDSSCYIKYADKMYLITSAIDVDLEHKMLEIYCVEYTGKEEAPNG